MRGRDALIAAGLAACSGTLLGCAFAPVGIWPLAALAPAPLIAIAALHRNEGRTIAVRRTTLLAVFAVAVAQWFALHFWLVQVTVPGLIALSVYCALFTAGALWALSRIDRASAQLCGRALPYALLAPLALGGVEALRALVLFHGYPWFRWGHPLVELPALVQGADLVGELFASLLALAVAGAVVDLWRGPRRAGAAIAAAAIACSLGYGAWRLGEAPTGAGPGILAVQTNLATSNKLAWSASAQVVDLPKFAALTLRAARSCVERAEPVALVAWPETMLAGFGLEPETLRMQEEKGYFPGDRFERILQRLREAVGSPLLVGSPAFLGLREDGESYRWDQQYNSAYLVDRQRGPYPRYDKIFLAPFGETMPYISEWKWLEQSLLAIGARGMKFDLDVGGAPTRFSVPWSGGAVRIATPICFEDAMSWVCRELVFDPARSGGPVRSADLMINLTNDGWFGWYDGGRAQHLQIARLRCIETRTPMVRAANTGLCAGIDSSGRIVAPPVSPQAEGWVYAAAPLDSRTPPYAFVGEVGSALVMILSGALALLPASLLRRLRPGGPATGALAAAFLAAPTALLLGGCDDQQKAISQQPWSSRDQSIQPTGQATLSDNGRPVTQPLAVESSGSARGAAVSLLQGAARSQIPVFRANAVEALIYSPADLHEIVLPLLSDPNRGVRFVAALSIGRASLGDLADHVQPLLVDESLSVRAAAMYTLTKLGRPVDLTPLAAMVRSDDPEVRSNAYLVLGEIGNRSAVSLITDSLGKGMRQVNPARVRIVEMQAAEALVRLGQPDAIEPIRAALFAPGEQSEFTALAAQEAARLKDDGSRAILMRLIDASGSSARPTEVRIVCAAALAQISPTEGPQVTKIARLYLTDREPSVRGQAALALAWAAGPKGVEDLQRLLFDSDPTVQLSAAKAILIATRRR